MKRKKTATPRRTAKPKLTAADRHKRFIEMAHEVEADERQQVFEQAFTAVTSGAKRQSAKK